MKSAQALPVLAQITSSQWGLVTSAQAAQRAVGRQDLARLVKAGHLERVAHGVYRDAGATVDEFEDLRAAWLSSDPAHLGEERLTLRERGVVVAGASAARLHRIGDLWGERHDFVALTRRQSQRADMRYRVRTLRARDVTLIEGLPTMTIERTIADLVDDMKELSLVADVLRDAWLNRSVDLRRLRVLLAPLAERNGFAKGDGAALLNHLAEIAGIDSDSTVRRIAADATLGPLVAAKVLSGLGGNGLAQLVLDSASRDLHRSFQATIASELRQSLLRQSQPRVSASSAHVVLSNLGVDDVAREVTAQILNGTGISTFGTAWTQSLGKSVAMSRSFTAKEAMRAVSRGRP